MSKLISKNNELSCIEEKTVPRATFGIEIDKLLIDLFFFKDRKSEQEMKILFPKELTKKEFYEELKISLEKKFNEYFRLLKSVKKQLQKNDKSNKDAERMFKKTITNIIDWANTAVEDIEKFIRLAEKQYKWCKCERKECSNRINEKINIFIKTNIYKAPVVQEFFETFKEFTKNFEDIEKFMKYDTQILLIEPYDEECFLHSLNLVINVKQEKNSEEFLETSMSEKNLGHFLKSLEIKEKRIVIKTHKNWLLQIKNENYFNKSQNNNEEISINRWL